MNIAADALVSDLVDQGETLDDNGQAILEVDQIANTATVAWTEPLAFHAAYNGDDWTRHVDADGYLTPAAEPALAERLSGMFPESCNGTTIFTDYDDVGDAPAIRFELTTSYLPGETFDHWFDRIGWPIVATLVNVTDPGTFGSPYLFDMGSL